MLGKKYRAEVNVNGTNQHTARERVVKSCQPSGSPATKSKTSNPTRERVAEESGVSQGSVRNAEVYSKAVDRLEETGVGFHVAFLDPWARGWQNAVS